jgi:hypothetical protein
MDHHMCGASHCRKGVTSVRTQDYCMIKKMVLDNCTEGLRVSIRKISFIVYIVNEPCSYFLKVDSHIHAGKQRTGRIW